MIVPCDPLAPKVIGLLYVWGKGNGEVTETRPDHNKVKRIVDNGQIYLFVGFYVLKGPKIRFGHQKLQNMQKYKIRLGQRSPPRPSLIR